MKDHHIFIIRHGCHDLGEFSRGAFEWPELYLADYQLKWNALKFLYVPPFI